MSNFIRVNLIVNLQINNWFSNFVKILFDNCTVHCKLLPHLQNQFSLLISTHHHKSYRYTVAGGFQLQVDLAKYFKMSNIFPPKIQMLFNSLTRLVKVMTADPRVLSEVVGSENVNDFSEGVINMFVRLRTD